MKGLYGDGTLESWNLIGCNLTALPEEFGAVRTTGHLALYNNKLTSLPESFGNLRVGGTLWLSNNQLTSLPESFGNLRVGGNLGLYSNQLTSLPESFANITVGGDLYLKYGGDIGPAMGEARALNYCNVKGKVWK